MEMTALVVTEVTEVMAMMVAGIQLLVGTGHSEDGGMVGIFLFVCFVGFFVFYIVVVLLGASIRALPLPFQILISFVY